MQQLDFEAAFIGKNDNDMYALYMFSLKRRNEDECELGN
jgi:hypothetical protein